MISDEGLAKLASALTTNTSVTDIDVSNNSGYSEEATQAIKELTHRNKAGHQSGHRSVRAEGGLGAGLSYLLEDFGSEALAAASEASSDPAKYQIDPAFPMDPD